MRMVENVQSSLQTISVGLLQNGLDELIADTTNCKHVLGAVLFGKVWPVTAIHEGSVGLRVLLDLGVRCGKLCGVTMQSSTLDQKFYMRVGIYEWPPSSVQVWVGAAITF
jgi:hypothetical protein